MTHYYFAYGSNISSKRLQARCPSAQFVSVAYMNNLKLCFPQHRLDGVLVAGHQESIGQKLWGVIYAIQEVDLASLDKAEDYQESRAPSLNSYLKIKSIKLFDQNETEIILDAFVYRQNKEHIQPAINGRHDKEYLNHIISGYLENGLDKLAPEVFREVATLI